jgi:hypothetical protein
VQVNPDVFVQLARSARLFLTWGSRLAVLTEGKSTLLHRWPCNLSGTDVIDHLNGNQFDNRRSNPAIRNRSPN